MRSILLSTVTATCLLATTNIQKQYEITPMLGYVIPQSNVTFLNHAAVGISVGINQDSSSKIDQYEIGFVSTSSAEYDNKVSGSDLFKAFVNGVKKYPINENLNLYALAGLGYEHIFLPLHDNEAGGFINYGVGLKYKLSDKYSFKFDVRHLLKFDSDINVLITAGISIPFGEQINIIDLDNDGVDDFIDLCPNTIEDQEVNSTTGCAIDIENIIIDTNTTSPMTTDTDGDGIYDANDICPNTISGYTVDQSGCMLDSDKDGINDAIDSCPNTIPNTQVNEKGCDAALAKVQILDITFETGSTKIEDQDISKFDKYISYLLDNNQSSIIFEAHTDSSGDARNNLELSKERANSAKTILINRGISEERIKAVGYGEYKPLVPNDTKANRQKNRRITAQIVD